VTRIKRLLKITKVICKYRLDEFVPVIHLPPAIKLLFMLAPLHLFPKAKQSPGERIRLALEELGPIFVKFGQILSTRRDLLPDDIADELKKLQDRVPPFDSKVAIAIIEKSLKAPISELFTSFDVTPLASASVAQVHTATLRNGDKVIVKVIRPDIKPVINQDIALMMTMAALLEKFWEDGARLRPVEVVQDYQSTILDELDLQREAANASQLRRNFEDSPLIYIPKIYWDYTHPSVLVMERIYGIPIADVDTLKSNQINLKRLAEKGVEIFFTQVFRDSFFHADMHPGNIFVAQHSPNDPQYIAVDFGIMGTLTPADQGYLARNLLAFFKRDYHQVAQLHIQSGWVPPTTKVNEFESAIRTVCEPIFEKPLKDISFGNFLLRLFQTARRFDMEVQPQLVLLQKTLLNIEGLGRQLYPDLDLWSTAQPYLEKWMRERMAPLGMLKSLKNNIPDWLEQTPEMPQLLHDAIKQVSMMNTPPMQNTPQPSVPDRNRRRLIAGPHTDYAIAATLFAVAWLTQDAGIITWIQTLPPFTILLGAAGIYFLARRKSA
jgi:ubiquinone biosynthesis protein